MRKQEGAGRRGKGKLGPLSCRPLSGLDTNGTSEEDSGWDSFVDGREALKALRMLEP